MSEEHKSRYELFLEEEERAAQPTKRCAQIRKRKYKSQEDRFWKLYHSRTIKAGECVEWTGAYKTKRWGSSKPVCKWNGKPMTSVRRVVYQLSIGNLLDGASVITTCRNNRCVRHSHLKSVSPEELEVLYRNSAPTGARHGTHTHPGRCRVKLNELLVLDIRARHRKGDSQTSIAADCGLARGTVWKIVHYKSWSHVQ